MPELFNKAQCVYKINWRLSTVLILVASSVMGCASIKQNVLLDTPFDIGPQTPIEEILAEADKALSDGDIDTAQLSYALAVERDPANVEALYKLGFVHSQKSSPYIAVSLLRHAVQNDPSHQGSRQLLGMVLLQLEQLKEAEATFKHVLAADPNAWQSLNGLGVIRDLEARHADAQSFFEKAKILQPRSAKIANNLGYSHYLEGNFDKAEQLFIEAVGFNSNYDRAWSNLALVYSREGRLRDASAAFRKVVSEHQAANNLGYLGILQGDPDLAQRQLEKAIQISPSYYEVANRNLEDAKEPITSVLAIQPISSRKMTVTGEKSRSNNSSAFETLPIEQIHGYLNFLGYDVGAFDGSMSSSISQAIKNYQAVKNINVDGKVGRITSRALIKDAVIEVQGVLLSLGFDIRSVDGKNGVETRKAIGKFQRLHGLADNGDVDVELIRELSMARSRVLKELNSENYLSTMGRG